MITLPNGNRAMIRTRAAAIRPNAIRLMPPLTVSTGEIDQAMVRLNTALVEAAKKD